MEDKHKRLDKVWEKSIIRITCTMIIMYLAVLMFNLFINDGTNVFLDSAIPAIAFTFATIITPVFKRIWEKWYLYE